METREAAEQGKRARGKKREFPPGSQYMRRRKGGGEGHGDGDKIDGADPKGKRI
jgi:hypothetical protein